MKQVLLSLFLFGTLQIFALEKSSEFNCDKIIFTGRGAEIRYIIDHPADQNFILVDEKKYPVFNSKKEALTYVENMTIKYDITIVYVRSEIAKETEFTDIIE